jgi:ribosome-binding factor A
MPSRKQSRPDLLASCDLPGQDDEVDPRLDRREGASGTFRRKARQLCAQVARTLNGVLAECGDDVLRELLVESVVPSPNTLRLLVTVVPCSAIEVSQVLQHLERARGRLRSETATAIHRRRAPDLSFRVAVHPTSG